MLNFGIIPANAKLFQDFFTILFGMILPWLLPWRSPYIVICNIIGNYDEKSGFWQIENNLSYRCTPSSEEMLRSIREIKKTA
ncbi:MAG TPA: hypothetical protein P5013_07165 [Methanoregula sp.]|nr:hypothetical protein [Methanoregula sp.]